MPWEFDAQVESTPLSTTGGHTWAAARRLADYLAAAAPQLGLHRPGLRLLELGAGTGWLGVTVARNLPDAALVCLTEQEGGLAHLASNVALNAERGLRLGHVRVQPCDWRTYGDGGGDGGAAGGSRAGQQQPDMPPQQQQQQQEQQQPPLDLQAEWDVIFGSDLIFNEIGSRCLPRVLAALVRPHTQVIYCHTKHRLDLLDLEFFEQLSACGLQWEEVWEPGVPPPPASPPLRFPPLDLFPEQRIAVLSISRAGEQQQ